ncbi:hypothetical protein [Hymenobacter jeollabukensis]|uniref:Tol-pal system protein YbgF n=1 Tax=Hymenobacter jeollabukensis TaxID=2025313 RepID=A0A5R8WWP3_9BACT|nr:hypothetical protein [Hymenobacter jeollabukensis]TLM96886.1 hypothetical protein FDY95_02520 [Hymenobacter jeollabukensis]
MPSTLFRFLLLFALLLLGYASAHAQTPAERPNTSVTGFGDPEPMDPRYAQASELTELKTQLQNLLQAYDQLVTRYNAQNVQLQQLERQQAISPANRSRAQRMQPLASGSY